MIDRRNQFIRSKRQKSRFSRILFYIVTLIFLGELVYLALFSPFMLISKITVDGNAQIDQLSILDSVNSQLSGKYLNILNKNNLILVISGTLENILLGQFRQIRTAEIRKKFPSTLKINIVERQTKLAVKSQEKCFLLDENGEAFDYIDCDSNKLKDEDLILFQDQSGKEIIFGSVALGPDLINYVLSLKNQLKEEMDLDLENNFWTPNIISGDIRTKTQESWDIYFNREINLDKEMEMLKVFLSNKIEKDQRTNLEYIDLRIDNKVYYKFREGSQKEISKPSETIDKNDVKDSEKNKKNKA